MSIRVVCSKCGKRRKVRDKLAGQEVKCRKCGGLIPVLTPEGESTDRVSVTPEPTTRTHRVWHVGSARWNKWSLAAAREFWLGRQLKRARERTASKPDVSKPDVSPVPRPGKTYERQTYRKSVVVGTIGHVLLIPSILGIFLNIVLLVSTICGLAGNVSGMTDIPEPIIERVMRVEPLTEQELDSLTLQQQRAIRSAQVALWGVTLGPGRVFGGGVILGAVIWLVAGFIGWLLVLKGKVLQCDALEEIVAAQP